MLTAATEFVPKPSAVAQQATFVTRERGLEELARNPVDRLTELMNLRDRGDLTAEALRQKLIGQ